MTLTDAAKKALYRYGIPQYMRVNMISYVERRQYPGDFLNAILCNDFVRAAMHSNGMNTDCLYGYAQWLLHHAPRECWGDVATVVSWLETDQVKLIEVNHG